MVTRLLFAALAALLCTPFALIPVALAAFGVEAVSGATLTPAALNAAAFALAFAGSLRALRGVLA